MDTIDNTEKKTKIFSDKKLLILLLVILFLGIFVRLYKYSEVGYWNDDETTLPTGFLWFFPHDFYPGMLGQGEPAFGNYIIAKGCMLSGEDFSGVTQMKQRFYPGREILIGKQLLKANDYCHASMYIFSILFLLAITLISFLLLKKHGAIFVIGLLSFNSLILVFSRWIHVDIILYTFVIIGLFALFKSLKTEKGSLSEKVWWAIAVSMMAFALGTKLPAAVYIIFSGIVMSAKYWNEVKGIFQKISLSLDLQILKGEYETTHQKTFLHLVLLALIVYFTILFFVFEGFSNITAVAELYRSASEDYGAFSINIKEIVPDISKFLQTFSNLEMIILIASIIYFPFALRSSLRGSLEEKFIAALLILLFVMILIMPGMRLERIFFLFSFGWIFFAGMLVDRLVEKFHILRNGIFIIAMLLIFAIPLFNAVYTSPDFISNYKAYNVLSTPTFGGTGLNFGARWIGEYLEKTLEENETYFPADPMTMVTYYVRYDQQLLYYIARENFKAQFGRSPTVEEYVENFKPNNQRIRYILIDKNTQNKEEFVQDILQNYEPMHIIYQPSIRQVETIRIYDLDNLVKKK